ncbi:hypothetical protein BMW23_0519 [Bodo saltans virus]|uniref:Uncharacterized protein n=1 Tax=Bodo saltans virus TaxID=2024608 RepID=A0A2H4UUM6_9VIRU|nr:hypothetical protein QJ851_gp0503 [Bodo saltans virus]ATZ80566.1 hypothetical protein BMW23_0519 [Bodo saltans virus]
MMAKEIEYKICTACPKATNNHKIEDFINNGKIYATCITCRKKSRKVEAMYENTLLIACINNMKSGQNKPCYLTQVGGGR